MAFKWHRSIWKVPNTGKTFASLGHPQYSSVDLGDGANDANALQEALVPEISVTCAACVSHAIVCPIRHSLHDSTEESVDEDFMVIKPIVLW